MFSEEESIDVRAGNRMETESESFCCQAGHENEKKHFMVTLFKIVMNHNSYIASKLRAMTLTVSWITETALIGPTKRGPFEVKPWNA